MQNVIKIDPYNFELYRFEVGAFFETVYIGLWTHGVVVVLWASEKDIEDDHYLVPSALYEAAMVHLSTGHYTEAKDLLTQAK